MIVLRILARHPELVSASPSTVQDGWEILKQVQDDEFIGGIRG